MALRERIGTAALRLLEPERAHGLALAALKAGLAPRPAPAPARLATRLFGRELANPLGLAAGFDKGAEAPDAALAAGFGFVEVGAVTPRPQPGNPRPRLFRLAEDRAAINRFGFNSEGLEVVRARLAARAGRGGLVGVNLGANKDSADRAGDYVALIEGLRDLAGFLTVNVSSPNTHGLRGLQGRAALDRLLERCRAAAETTPLAVKIAPDLSDEEIADVAAAARAHGLDAIVATNTTLAREALRSRHAEEEGGLSGRPLFPRSTEALRALRRLTKGEIALIGVGGIEDGATAYAKVRAGADALQLYTALIWGGLGLVGRILSDLDARLERDGFARLEDAVGVDA